jgi:hypothetical protein
MADAFARLADMLAGEGGRCCPLLLLLPLPPLLLLLLLLPLLVFWALLIPDMAPAAAGTLRTGTSTTRKAAAVMCGTAADWSPLTSLPLLTFLTPLLPSRRTHPLLQAKDSKPLLSGTCPKSLLLTQPPSP